MEGFLGEVKMFAGSYAPRTWAFCDGSLLKVAEYTALFSVLGTYYGGDGRTTFALPDLRGRVAVGTGSGTGLTPKHLGEKSGSETVQLSSDNLPPHNHKVKCDKKTSSRSLSADPVDKLPAQITQGEAYGSDATGDTVMNELMIENSGKGTAHYNLQPYLSINYIICVEGEYPPRN
jgi:microcystin-dependent protein